MSSKYNIKQRNYSVQGLRSFKDTLPTKAKRIILKKGDVYTKTLDNWKYLVGKDFFKICYPKSFKNSNLRGKCLNIMVKHGYQIDLEYSKQEIINKINYFFGRNVIDNIFLNTFENEIDENLIKSNYNVTKSKYKRKIISVKNSRIKNSLNELIKVYKKK